MKKLRKDGGAIGSGIGNVAAGASAIGGGLPKGLTDENLSDKSVRPWFFKNHRRIERAGLKAHELEYMDLTRRENQLLDRARNNRFSKGFRDPEENFENENFLEFDSEIFSDDSDGTANVESPVEGFKENPEVYVLGATFFLVIWFLVFVLLFL
jgi:hypothetical protein